jgi:ketosteroid isomerase-like protein
MSRFSLSDPGRRQRCWTTGYVHEQENRKTIDQVYSAFGDGDIEGVLGMLTNDVQWTSPGPSDVITYASSRTGDEQVAGYVEARCEAVETTMLRPQRFFAQDDLVVVLGRYTLRVVMTRTVIDNDWVRTFELADGKISALEGKLAVDLP